MRTIQRDINEKLAFLPIQKSDGLISLEASALGRLSAQDIRNFASIAGVNELFLQLSPQFISNVLR